MDSKMQKELTKQLSVARQTSVDMARRHTQDLKTAKEAVALATDVARVAKEEYARLDRIFIRGQSQSRNYMKKGKLKKGKYIHGEDPDTSTLMLEEQERQKRLQWKIWQDAKMSLDLAVSDLNKVHGTKLKSGLARPDDVSTGMTEAEGADLLKSLVADTSRAPRRDVVFWPRGATRKKKSRRSKRRSTKRRRTRRSRKRSTKRRRSRKGSTKRRRRSHRSRKRSTKRRRHRSRRS
jgi:hypothetical protein